MSVVRVSAQPNLNNLYHWKHPPEALPYSYNVPLWCPVITHHAPALIFQPSEGERVLRGLGQSPIKRTWCRYPSKNLEDPGKRCIFAPENPTARPTGQECQPPERILRNAAQLTAFDQPRWGFSCLHTHTRAHALDTYQLTAAVWNIDTCLSEYRHQPIIYRRLSISEGRIIDTSL